MFNVLWGVPQHPAKFLVEISIGAGHATYIKAAAYIVGAKKIPCRMARDIIV